VIVPLTVGALVACSLSTPYDAAESNTPDATVGPGSDGAPPSDGSAQDASDAGCNATFCDDFDTPPLGATWTTLEEDEGELTLDDGGALSPPFAMKVDLPGGDSHLRDAFLMKRFNVVASVTCSFAVKPLVANGYFELFEFRGDAPAVDKWEVTVGMRGGDKTELGSNTAIGTQETPGPIDVAPFLPLNAWSHLEVSTDLAQATLKLEGAPVANITLPVQPRAIVDVLVGAYASETSPESALFDDIRCTVK
jgi:hypothetical protein